MKITLDLPDNMMSTIRKRSINQGCTMNQAVLELLGTALGGKFATTPLPADQPQQVLVEK
jgi:hypothetical protein